MYRDKLPTYQKLLASALIITITITFLYISDKKYQKKMNNLIHYGIKIDYVPIIDKQYNKGKTFNGVNAYNLYKYNFQVLDKIINGDFSIRLNPSNIKAPPYIQNFKIGDHLSILYLEDNPEIHTVIKINDYFTILPTDTVSYIIPFESNAFIPELKCIERYKNINWK